MERVVGGLDLVHARANVLVETVDARSGRVLFLARSHNLVTDAGLNLLRDLVYGDGVTITHGAVGTDATTPDPSDTTLAAETVRDLIAQRTKAAQELVVKFVVGSTQGNGTTLREAGLFNAASAGTLYARVTPTAVVKTDAILVIYTWTLGWAAV